MGINPPRRYVHGADKSEDDNFGTETYPPAWSKVPEGKEKAMTELTMWQNEGGGAHPFSANPGGDVGQLPSVPVCLEGK